LEGGSIALYRASAPALRPLRRKKWRKIANEDVMAPELFGITLEIRNDALAFPITIAGGLKSFGAPISFTGFRLSSSDG